MSSEQAPERRLHPLSFLFTLLEQLKQFAIPLILLLVTGRRSDSDLWGLIGVVVLALVSVAQYFTYRYRIEADGVVIRSGLFQRSLRHIPFSRIQNVSLHQNLLHRLAGVAEVRLESAGAAKPEGQMRVLRLDDAHALEQQVRGSTATRARAQSADGAAADAVAAPPRLLLSLPLAELIRLGLISNRGMLVVGGALAVLAQAGDNLLGKLFTAIGEWVSGQATALHLSVLAIAGAAALLLVLAVVALRLLSVLLALLQFHGFRLTESEGRLAVERGLLTRIRASLPRHRIQAWSLSEGLLHRWFGRQSLRVDSAVVEAMNEKRSLRDLAPIATPSMIDALIDELLPERAWPVREWQALHPQAWRRKLLVPAIVVSIVALVLALWKSPWALSLFGLLPLFYWRARNWARHSAWSIADGLVAFRGGWLDRHWRFAETRKLQAIEWSQSPLDRRMGMATLRFDTAGAGSMEPALAIPFLPATQARELYAQLSAALAGAGAAPIRSRIAVSATPGS